MLKPSRKLLWQWNSWFFIANVFLFLLLGVNYLKSIPWLNVLSWYGKFYLLSFSITAYITDFTLLALAIFVWLGVWIIVFPNKRWILFQGILCGTLIATFIIVDLFVYRLYRFHLNGVMVSLLVHGLGKEILGLSTLEFCWMIIAPLCILLIEIFLALYIWRKMVLKDKTFKLFRLSMIGFFAGSIYLSYALIFFGLLELPLSSGRMMLDAARFLPFYVETVSFMARSKDIEMQKLAYRFTVQPSLSSSLPDYPKILSVSHANLNIVVIVIDAWRFDMLQSAVTPHLAAFAKTAWQFQNHFSGGDATAPGVFSLFYGLPSTYWNALKAAHQSPVWINQLLQDHYVVGIFSSATLHYPAFDQTVFANLTSVPQDTLGKTPDERDRNVTKNFRQFIEKNKQHTFFSFLFYDAAHSYCETKNVSAVFKPEVSPCNRLLLNNQSDPTPYLNRYKNALLFVDQQINQDLTLLNDNGLLNHTVVIITGDHGEEFNDNHLGFWGHASNFTHYQVETPFIVFWPGEKPTVFTHETSHYDLAPTLLGRLWHVKAAASSYSVGKDLLDETARPYLIVGSYINFGVVEPDRITTFFPAGNVLIESLNGRPLPDKTIHIALMQQAFYDLRRFYQDDKR